MPSLVSPSPRSRSPGRPREFDMDAVLDSAVRVFRAQGYHATSIADLSAATGLTAGSLYKAFKDKRELFLMAFDRYVAQRNHALQQRLAIPVRAREKIHALLRFYAESSQGEEGRRGCLVVASMMALATFDAELAAHVKAALRRNEDLLRKLLREGQRDGSISQDIQVPAMASVLLALMQGLRVIGKSGRTARELELAVGQAMRLL